MQEKNWKETTLNPCLKPSLRVGSVMKRCKRTLIALAALSLCKPCETLQQGFEFNMKRYSFTMLPTWEFYWMQYPVTWKEQDSTIKYTLGILLQRILYHTGMIMISRNSSKLQVKKHDFFSSQKACNYIPWQQMSWLFIYISVGLLTRNKHSLV